MPAAMPPFLLITRESIQFNPASDYDLDVAAFTALLAACERHPHRHLERCRSCAARLQQALTLYRGDFLAEFALGDSAPFDEWAAAAARAAAPARARRARPTWPTTTSGAATTSAPAAMPSARSRWIRGARRRTGS